jgi:hypothetical protein
MSEQLYSVRAMPPRGFDRRWCAGRPWTSKEVIVKVVDTVPPFDPQNPYSAKAIEASEIEISPLDLETLKKDRHIAVAIAGAPATDQLEMNAAKAHALELEEETKRVRAEHGDLVEELKRFKAVSQKEFESLGAKLAATENDLASARAQLSELRTKRAK